MKEIDLIRGRTYRSKTYKHAALVYMGLSNILFNGEKIFLFEFITNNGRDSIKKEFTVSDLDDLYEK
jgi:hypothetical protein